MVYDQNENQGFLYQIAQFQWEKSLFLMTRTSKSICSSTVLKKWLYY